MLVDGAGSYLHFVHHAVGGLHGFCGFNAVSIQNDHLTDLTGKLVEHIFLQTSGKEMIKELHVCSDHKF